jgi:hypothetical protein
MICRPPVQACIEPAGGDEQDQHDDDGEHLYISLSRIIPFDAGDRAIVSPNGRVIGASPHAAHLCMRNIDYDVEQRLQSASQVQVSMSISRDEADYSDVFMDWQDTAGEFLNGR